jgi:hypothetical protein
VSDLDWTQANWRSSTHSANGGGQCVEIAITPEVVGMRDSKRTDNAVLAIDPDKWRDFISAVKMGEFDS